MPGPIRPPRQVWIGRMGTLVVIVAICVYLLYPHVRGFFASDSLNRFTVTESSGHSAFNAPSPAVSKPVQRQLDQLRPEQAGWTSESLSSEIDKVLKSIADALLAGKTSASAGADAVAPSFRGEIASDEHFTPAFDSSFFNVRSLANQSGKLKATESIAEQFETLGIAGPAQDGRYKFKVISVSDEGNALVSRVLFENAIMESPSAKQWNASLKCRWSNQAGKLQLHEIEIDELTIVTAKSNGTIFRDVTKAAFANVMDKEKHLQQYQFDTGHWTKRLCKIDDASMFGHNGLAVGDVNGDGRADLYVCDTGGLPNRLYLQASDGTLQDVSADSNVDFLEATRSALLVDLDNDRDLDLVAATVAGIVFAENDGKARFRIRNALAGASDAYSMAAADYDNDRDLDIYITVYGPSDNVARARGFEAAAPVPYDDANNGGRNLLLQNEGSFSFRDVASAVGLDANDRRFSFAAAWEDYDADGDVDLYVANDFGRNNLYKNENGKFRDIAGAAAVEDRAGGMSVAWGDPNLDGRSDIYVGNMFSAAGSRVTYQRRFLSTRSSESSTSLQRMARGNTLFLAEAGDQFVDVSIRSSAWMGRWAWGSKFADFNNDGSEDLIVTNGYFTNQRKDDL